MYLPPGGTTSSPRVAPGDELTIHVGLSWDGVDQVRLKAQVAAAETTEKLVLLGNPNGSQVIPVRVSIPPDAEGPLWIQLTATAGGLAQAAGIFVTVAKSPSPSGDVTSTS
jgi:hypothetical protein